MSLSFHEMLDNQLPIIFDGAMGTELQKFNITSSDVNGKIGCNEILNLTRPDIIKEIHCHYYKAGAHVVTTNTFGGNRLKLNEYDLGDQVREINIAAAEAAIKAGKECSERDCFVAGDMGPTGFILSSSDSSLEKITFDQCVSVFEEQATALVEGGVDILILETMQDLLEVRAAIFGINKIFKKLGVSIPVQVQVTMDAQEHMLLGSDISAFLGAVANFKPAVMGLNCSTGPKGMEPHIKKLIADAPCYVSMIPNAGMPENVDGKAVYSMEPTSFAREVTRMVTDLGVAVVGGCCGTSPDHIRSLTESLNGKKVKDISRVENGCFIASGIAGVGIHKAKRPFVVGERLNTQGSRKTKELVLSRNYDELFQLALGQIEKKCLLLDLCMAINERDDEKETIENLVSYLAERVSVPFCIDSTDPAVFSAGLKKSPGSVLINSINLEHGGDKARQILSVARDFACPIVALPIDDSGMAKTVEQKLEGAEKIIDIVCNEFGLPKHFIYYDPLVFTLATGDRAAANAAKDSLEAIRLLKEKHPDMNTIMGVSNVSFGLRPIARRILNNLMLHHSSKAGLDAAIFNPLHMDDVNSYHKDVRNLGEELLFNKRDDSLSLYVDYFEKLESGKKGAKNIATKKSESLSNDKLLYNKVLTRDKRDISSLIDKLLVNNKPATILNSILLPAMAEVGNLMAKGEMILPFVLQAAEVMKTAVTVLEPYFEKEKMEHKGKMILATVFGDVHDIGKNLVGSIMKNQGYDIIDLGKQVSLETILDAIKKEKPDALGLSALLVTTSREMEQCVKELDLLGYSIPVIIGGAAVNQAFADRIAFVEKNRKYSGNVYYAKDAFGAVKVLENTKNKKTNSIEKPIIDIVKSDKPAMVDTKRPEPLEFDNFITPPFYETGEILTWDTETLLQSIDKQKLFKGYWRAGKLGKEEYKQVLENEFEDVFKLLSEEIVSNNLIDARGFYGFFPVISDDTKLILLDPSNFTTEIATFDFPPIERRNGRCFADYFRPETDVFSAQIVTIGAKLSNRSTQYFQKEDKYSLGFFLNGIGTYIVEILADKVTSEIRRGLVLPKDQGKRFSFGYKGLPDVSEQEKLFRIMNIEDRIGIILTKGFQMIPEHSTLGIYVHHPETEYF